MIIRFLCHFLVCQAENYVINEQTNNQKARECKRALIKLSRIFNDLWDVTVFRAPIAASYWRVLRLHHAL